MVEVTEMSDSSYSIIVKSSFVLTVSQSKEKAELVLKGTDATYTASYSIPQLEKINEKLAAFKTIDEFVKTLSNLLKAGKITLKELSSKCFLQFEVDNTVITLDIPKEGLNPHEDNDIESLKKTAFEAQENYKKLKKDYDAILLKYEELKKEFLAGNENYFRIDIDVEKMKAIQTLKDHSLGVNCLCVLKDGRLASSSADKTIRIYNLSNFKCEAVLESHTKGVTYITQLENGCLASSSGDGKINIWKANNQGFDLVETLHGHENWVNKIIQLSKGRMASCSNDYTLRVWKSSEPYKCILSVQGNASPINSVIELRNKKNIVSAGLDCCISFWNNITYDCEHEIPYVGCYSNNSLIEIDNNRLIVGGYDGEVSVINTTTFQLEGKIILFKNGSGSTSSLLELVDGNVLCGCYGGEMFKINAYKFTIEQSRKKMHDGNVTSLVLSGDNKMLISCSHDESIKVWELESEEEKEEGGE